jgi:hypothetical protein
VKCIVTLYPVSEACDFELSSAKDGIRTMEGANAREGVTAMEGAVPRMVLG